MTSIPESAGSPFSPRELAAWHGFLQVNGHILRELDSALIAGHNLPVRAFDVLITLFNAPDRRLRMSELAQSVMISASGLTRMVERLERDRLVERRPDAGDRRSYHAVLTDAGLRRLDEARITHNAVIRRLYLAHLTDEEMDAQGEIWTQLLRSIGDCDSPPP